MDHLSFFVKSPAKTLQDICSSHYQRKASKTPLKGLSPLLFYLKLYIWHTLLKNSSKTFWERKERSHYKSCFKVIHITSPSKKFVQNTAHSENGRNGHTDDWASSIRQSLIFSHSFSFSWFLIFPSWTVPNLSMIEQWCLKRCFSIFLIMLIRLIMTTIFAIMLMMTIMITTKLITFRIFAIILIAFDAHDDHDYHLFHHAHDAHADPNNNRQTDHVMFLCRLCSSFYDWRRIFLNHHQQTDHPQNLCHHAHDAHNDHDQQNTIFAITLMMLTMTMIRPPSLPLCSLLMMLSMTRAAVLE